jgi:hypothetical protein
MANVKILLAPAQIINALRLDLFAKITLNPFIAKLLVESSH